ncbi:sensor histidine kinase [Planosporangium thailandense]|uniref:sensor histidine kinase n=1 Tax=Planosporangium thailandense TaxID=765197 RepID=UPI0030B81B41
MTARGQLRVYLGAAPGVGKTYKMLDEGHRRRDRGTDVVVGYVECHGRKHTEALVAGLEVAPRKTVTYRGATFTEMDLDAVLARRPRVALVDELAHTNVPGSGNAKRWQDVQQLLDAGIDVITTLNIQHLESLNDVVAQITRVPQRETVPDEVVRRAEQIELVDMTPEALRRRLAHGNVYAPDKIDAALGNYFRVGNLTALRELALLWLADKVDDQLDRYRAEHHIDTTWETRERVVVALTGGPEGDTLIRRAARIADRSKGADLLAVHVARSDGLAGADPAHLARQRALVESLGGTYHQVVGTDIPAALLEFARGVNATQLVLGASRRGRLAQLFSPGVAVTTTAESGPIDVHLVTHEEVKRGRARITAAGGLAPIRRWAGFALAALGLPALTVGLTQVRGHLSLPSDILLYLAAVVAVALVGGLYPALIAAVAGFLLLNWYFTPPIHQWTIAERENILALAVFLLVAGGVSTVVDLAARRTRDAARARAEAETLSTLAGSVLRGTRPLPALLDRLRETFQLTGVTLLERREDIASGPDLQHDPAAWRLAAAVGDQPCLTPAQGDADVSVGDVCLVLRGHPLAAADRRVVEAFAAQAAVALRQERLAEQAAAVGPLAEVDRLRTALLSAVSHDLRTPLASAKAAVDGLRIPDVEFSDADRDELLATAGESLERLSRLVENLLDMSRLQAGVLAMAPQLTSLAEAIPLAVDDLADGGHGVRIRVPDDLPEVHADPALLERALANVLANALRYSPPDQPPLVTASEYAGQLEVRIIDHGPGVPAADWDRIFLPFQRLGDRDNATGVGLGLALSRGLIEAMGGTLTPETTPGGGLTMVISLPAAPPTDDGPDQATEPTILDHIDRIDGRRDGEQGARV